MISVTMRIQISSRFNPWIQGQNVEEQDIYLRRSQILASGHHHFTANHSMTNKQILTGSRDVIA